MAVLWKSKAFWIAVLDMVAGLLTLLGNAYWPDQVDTVNKVWFAIQPVLAIIIAAFATAEVFVPLAIQGFTKAGLMK
jgi:hypothetical protein